jgi:ankyrin repeat protein
MKIDSPDHAGYTPLLAAVFYNSKECVQLLLQDEVSSLLKVFITFMDNIIVKY